METDESIVLAKELIGQKIDVNGNAFVITVTEAYPYNEELDENNCPISYVNRYKTGISREILTNKNNGENHLPFVWGDMLHIACKGGLVETENGREEYHCGNVLIRGAISIDEKNNKMIIEKPLMSFLDGQPIIISGKMNVSEPENIVISSYLKLEEGDVEEETRVNLPSNNKYRFYLKRIKVII